MSSDNEDEVFAYTPLQRWRSQISSSEIAKERKPTTRISLTQTGNKNNIGTSNKKLRVSLKKITTRGRGHSKSSRSSPKFASDDIKPLPLAKRQFLYGVPKDNTSGTAISSQDNPSCSQWEEEDRKYATKGQKNAGLTGRLAGEWRRGREDNFKSVKQEEWEDTVCPHCMMPWNTYDRDSKLKEFHTDECLDKDLSSRPDCQHGLDCKEILENHFWTFNHRTLATLHGMKKTPSDDSGYEDRSGEGSLGVYRSSFARKTEDPNLKVKLPSTPPCSTSKEFSARVKMLCSESDNDEDAIQTESDPLFDDYADAHGNQNKSSKKSNEVHCSERRMESTGNANDSNRKGIEESSTQQNSETVTTHQGNATNTLVTAGENCASSQTNNTVKNNTSKDFSALIDSEDIPNLELNNVLSGSASNSSSEDQTILFNKIVYAFESQSCSNAEDSLDEASNIFNQCTQVFHNRTSTPKESSKLAQDDSSDISAAKVMSQSVTQNFSRHLFIQKQSSTNEHQRGTQSSAESECLATDALKLTWDGDGNQSDKTCCSQVEEKNQNEIDRKTTNINTSTILLPTEEDKFAFKTHSPQTDKSESAATEEERERAKRTDEIQSGNLVGIVGDLREDEESRNLAGTLEDCEEDELLVNLVEAAVEKYFGSVVDKVRDQKGSSFKTPLKAASHTVNQYDDKATTSSNHQHGGLNLESGQCKASSHPCIHFHFHIDSPSPKKGGGQTSILNYFKPKTSKASQETEHQSSGCMCKCRCGQSTSQHSENTTNCNVRIGGSSKRRGVEEWQEVMAQMKKRRTPLPSVSGSSVASEVDTGTSHVQERRWGGQHEQRKCPFYKYIPDTNVVVDAFCYGSLEGVEAYFLSHYHYDHYRGLTKTFAHPIYCSSITAKLVKARLGVKEQHLNPLPMGETQTVCGFEVTLLDANHCPGAVMFLFKLKNGKTILHTGDFRAHPRMESYPAFWNIPSINTVFLDTTYCNPVYDFPSQGEVLEACVAITQRHMADNPNTLIVVGSYCIGKERVFKAIAEGLNCRVWASADKRRILSYLEDTEIQSRICADKKLAKVHVLSMGQLSHKKLMAYVSELHPQYNVVVAFRPTGWEHSAETPISLESITPKQVGNVSVYGMPYSEHSSFLELRRFVQFTQPDRIIPTVNVGNANTRRMMEGHFNDWLKTRRKFNKGHFSRK